jgi:hypothetical protein
MPLTFDNSGSPKKLPTLGQSKAGRPPKQDNSVISQTSPTITIPDAVLAEVSEHRLLFFLCAWHELRYPTNARREIAHLLGCSENHLANVLRGQTHLSGLQWFAVERWAGVDWYDRWLSIQKLKLRLEA